MSFNFWQVLEDLQKINPKIEVVCEFEFEGTKWVALKNIDDVEHLHMLHGNFELL